MRISVREAEAEPFRVLQTLPPFHAFTLPRGVPPQNHTYLYVALLPHNASTLLRLHASTRPPAAPGHEPQTTGNEKSPLRVTFSLFPWPHFDIMPSLYLMSTPDEAATKGLEDGDFVTRSDCAVVALREAGARTISKG